SVSGSPAHPVLALKAAIAPLTWRDFNIERLEAEARYADESLVVSKLRAARGPLESSAEATIPIRIAFDRPWALIDRPMDATIRVRQGDLRILPLLVPQIAAASGGIEADVDVRGSALAPKLEGRARVSGGSLRLSGRDELLDHVEARMHMSDSTVTVDSLT